MCRCGYLLLVKGCCVFLIFHFYPRLFCLDAKLAVMHRFVAADLANDSGDRITTDSPCGATSANSPRIER